MITSTTPIRRRAGPSPILCTATTSLDRGCQVLQDDEADRDADEEVLGQLVEGLSL
jgi:hypothetical protein